MCKNYPFQAVEVAPSWVGCHRKRNFCARDITFFRWVPTSPATSSGLQNWLHGPKNDLLNKEGWDGFFKVGRQGAQKHWGHPKIRVLRGRLCPPRPRKVGLEKTTFYWSVIWGWDWCHLKGNCLKPGSTKSWWPPRSPEAAAPKRGRRL